MIQFGGLSGKHRGLISAGLDSAESSESEVELWRATRFSKQALFGFVWPVWKSWEDRPELPSAVFTAIQASPTIADWKRQAWCVSDAKKHWEEP